MREAGVGAVTELPEVAAATGVASLAWLLFVLPALGAAILLLAGRRADAWGHWLGVGTVAASFVIGLAIFLDTLALDPEARTREQSLFRWFGVGALQVDFGLRLDPLSLTFVLLITGVGALIHLYSVGYMAHDPGRRRFFGQLNLFVTAMLLLVLGNNFVMLYLGWEGVGLASYLLIGWYQDRPSAATAAKKAFLMNRVGDVGLALAIFLLWTDLGTLQYTEVFARVGELSGGAAPGDHAAAAARRLRQVRPVPAAGLAPGRDGRPDARSRRSSTRPRWSPRASTSSRART